MKRGKRALAVTLALALAASMVPLVNAEESYPIQGQGAKGQHQPNNHGYRPIDVANWSPEVDNNAEYTRAQVPVQKRIKAFAATQANPALSSKTQMAWVAGDYGNSKYESYQANDNFGNYLYNFWQYTDVYAPWHGMPTAEYPEEWYYANPKNPQFEGGTIYPPNMAYTNAAHKNGALSLACVFFPRPGQDCKSMIVKDENGNFPVAEGMVKLAKYYGFDGYFFNQEVTFQSSLVQDYKEFLTVLQDAGLYTQWYDSVNGKGSLSYQNSFNANNSMWVEENGIRYNDSMFVNYAWDYSNRVKSAYDYANSIGVDPWESLFLGIEFDKSRLNGGHSSGKQLENKIWGEDGQTMASIAMFRPEFVHACVTDPNEQWKVFERERMLYTSPNQDVLNTEKDPSVVRDDLKLTGVDTRSVNGADWNGTSHYITERSVIDGANFTTAFNTGHGMQYFKEGEVSNNEEWSNINIQDILPSWQWWMESEGTKLNVDFDYGEEYYYGPNNTYTQVGAYEGGSSLVVNGKLDAENVLRLYKTDLQVKDSTKVSITYNKVSASDNSAMELGVVFQDYPDKVVTFQIPNSNQQTDGWVTKSVDLSDYAGDRIAAIGLAFKPGRDGAIENYQMNIGRLNVSDGTDDTPEPPTGFTIKKMFDTKEAYVSWDIEDYGKVVQYNLYAQKEDGQKVYLGGIYDEAYYLKDLSGLGDVAKLLITAVSPNGYESEAAAVDYNFGTAVDNIGVTENAGYLDVTWDAPAAACSGVNVKVTFDYAGNDQAYETNVAADATSARVMVPVADGSRYTVTVSTVNEDGSRNKGACCTGRVKDCYSRPYNYDTAEPYTTNSYVRIEAPSSIDWWHMYVSVDGGAQRSILRGKQEMNNISGIKQNGYLTITLEDYRLNQSEPKLVAYSKDFSAGITEKDFPDAALLAAVKEQAGTTIRDVMLYDGTLDLSGLPITDLTGLTLLGNVKEINLSNTDITSLDASDFGGKYGAMTEKIDLSNCGQLTEIASDTFKGLNHLAEINLTGCSAMQALNLNNSSLERIVCDDPSVMAGISSADLSGSRFDLSAGTPEKAFVDAIGAAAGNQRPNLHMAEPDEIVRVQRGNNSAINMQDYLNAYMAGAVTVRGTALADLKDAGFIDPSYDLEAAVDAEDIDLIRVTDVNGNVSIDTINTSSDGVYTVEYITYHDAALNGKAVYTQTVKVRGITSILEEIIAEAERLQAAGALENTMEAVVNEFNAALEEARMIVEKDDASQKEINDSTLRLLAAIAKVDWKQGDKTILEIAVEVATGIEGNLDLYVEAGKQEFKDALAEARELLASGNAWQDDINDSVTRLTDAMKALRMTPNKDILNDMIANAKAMDLSAYTADTANAVRTALAAAEAVAADANADQKAVDAAANTLDAALKGLVVVNGSADNNAADDNANAGTTAPVGEGTTPTKTGDSPVAGLAALALMSAAAVVLLNKKRK